MQIVSIGDNLNKVPKPIFWKKYETYFNMWFGNWNQSAEH